MAQGGGKSLEELVSSMLEKAKIESDVLEDADDEDMGNDEEDTGSSAAAASVNAAQVQELSDMLFGSLGSDDGSPAADSTDRSGGDMVVGLGASDFNDDLEYWASDACLTGGDFGDPVAKQADNDGTVLQVRAEYSAPEDWELLVSCSTRALFDAPLDTQERAQFSEVCSQFPRYLCTYGTAANAKWCTLAVCWAHVASRVENAVPRQCLSPFVSKLTQERDAAERSAAVAELIVVYVVDAVYKRSRPIVATMPACAELINKSVAKDMLHSNFDIWTEMTSMVGYALYPLFDHLQTCEDFETMSTTLTVVKKELDCKQVTHVIDEVVAVEPKCMTPEKHPLQWTLAVMYAIRTHMRSERYSARMLIANRVLLGRSGDLAVVPSLDSPAKYSIGFFDNDGVFCYLPIETPNAGVILYCEYAQCVDNRDTMLGEERLGEDCSVDVGLPEL